MSGRAIRPRPPRRAWLIVCEGANTEPVYFTALVQRLGLAATVTVEVVGAPGCTDPVGLVKFAVTRVKQRKREAKNDLLKAKFEDVWIVFDTEGAQHPRAKDLPNVVLIAREHGFGLAVSRPSFEVWYILHDRSQPPGLACGDDAANCLTKILGTCYGKSHSAARQAAEWALPKTAVALRNGEKQQVFVDDPASNHAHLPDSTGTGVFRAVSGLVAMSSDAAGKALLGFVPEPAIAARPSAAQERS